MYPITHSHPGIVFQKSFAQNLPSQLGTPTTTTETNSGVLWMFLVFLTPKKTKTEELQVIYPSPVFCRWVCWHFCPFVSSYCGIDQRNAVEKQLWCASEVTDLWNPKWPLFFESQTPKKQGLFKAKVGSYGLQIYIYIFELQGKCPGGFI